MKTVNQLRELGYAIEPDRRNGLTHVKSNKLFYYFNPNFCVAASEIVDAIDRDCFGGVKLLTIAGEFDGGDVLPYILLSQKEEAKIQALNDKIIRCEAEMQRAYEEKVKTVKEFYDFKYTL